MMVSEFYPVPISQTLRSSRAHLSSSHSCHSWGGGGCCAFPPRPQRRITRPRELTTVCWAWGRRSHCGLSATDKQAPASVCRFYIFVCCPTLGKALGSLTEMRTGELGSKDGEDFLSPPSFPACFLPSILECLLRARKAAMDKYVPCPHGVHIYVHGHSIIVPIQQVWRLRARPPSPVLVHKGLRTQGLSDPRLSSHLRGLPLGTDVGAPKGRGPKQSREWVGACEACRQSWGSYPWGHGGKKEDEGQQVHLGLWRVLARWRIIPTGRRPLAHGGSLPRGCHGLWAGQA